MQPPWTPGTLTELSGSYWKTCALHAAVKLDIFTVIGSRELGSRDVAGELGASEEGISRLLNALAAMNLLEKSGRRFANVASVGALLRKDSPRYIGHIIRHHHHLMESWAQLDQAVQSGKPVRSRSTAADAEHRESFLMGMFNIAMATAPGIVSALSLGGRRHLLDLGGGPGTYAIHFCRQNPDLKATVIDLPSTRPFAEKTIARFGMSDRIDFKDANFLEDELEGRFDAAWLSHILHAEGPAECRRIIRKVAAVMAPAGLVAIHEFILDDTRDGPLFPTLFSLNMLLGTSSGRAYAESELTDMLAAAGFGQIERIAVDTPNDSAVLAAVRN